ncbi:MAG: rhodanese-like domain-containing protein [Flavobacteriaceae bacterium]|nr:rhodanese-like domain-containing protein [Flavobacteriaceae bacterium]MBT4113852.1 rhodanese-like domain-containing protein [Flavobacteriaceae bacterium]MBT4613789.1 rhodanese-like domain-containing protein [Flavobacteriaceae bacterium]MBT5246369.1 rhodanese-like domain-containing protein [Flavobacteriaceae bacterium]MBT5650422.1 rhodanese-like domain-containing protein [Flavobacteriaceae bacterium]
MNTIFNYFFTFIFFMLFSCGLNSNSSINQMNSDELLDFIEINNAILVDVRTQDEYNSGYIENSLNIDYLSNDFSENIEKLDKNISIILYCRSGKRSSMSANKLSKLGFKEIYNLDGGILKWIEIGNSVIFNDTIN